MSDLEALGNELRAAREARSLTPRQVERQTHIRARFIEALESGQLDHLPASVQTRGFLRNYARFLGLDGDVYVARWDEAALGGRRRRVARALYTPAAVDARSPEVGAPKRRGLLRRLAPVLILLILLAAGIFGVLFLTQDRPGNSGILALATLEPLPSSSPTLPPTPFASPTPNPNAPPPKGQDVFTNVTLQLEVVARTWLRVTVDGQVNFEGVPGPNTVLQYQGSAINVRASNAIGVRAVVNNRPLGLLGARGQTYDQTFTLDTLDTLEISPEFTPTPGPTPTLSDLPVGG